MFTLFKKLLGRSKPKVKASVSSVAQHEPSVPMPTVEVAHLSLAAIVARLPEELQPIVRQRPAEGVTVALPIPTILKQLPNGTVKMSLATLHRQAPAGLFAPIPPGDKRMVSVPLGEVFRHVSPYALKRRPDQRSVYLPPSGFNLFGNSENPYEIVAIDEAEPEPPPRDEPLKAPLGLRLERAPIPAFAPAAPAAALPTPRAIAPAPEYFEPTPRRVFPASPAPEPPKPAAPKSNLPPLRLALAPLTEAWPDEIKGELAALNGSAFVLVPTDDVSAGLAKGKVVLTWGQIRAGLEPALETPSVLDESTPLTLPLKFVAPAFLAASRQAKPEPRKLTVAADIPALFSNGRPPAAAAGPEPTAPPEPEAEAMDEESPEAEAEAAPAVEIQDAPAFALVPSIEAVPEPDLAESEASRHPPAPLASESPAAPTPAPSLSADKVPETIGEIFGEAEREHWTPNEIVLRVTQLPGIAGAVVALQEGLVVAQCLPEDVKGDVVAAFLPQIFARLNQYAGEMKLGEVDDLLFTTHGAHCQIYRLGYVYFAILGKPGESLPWHELQLIAEELAKQTQPA